MTTVSCYQPCFIYRGSPKIENSCTIYIHRRKTSKRTQDMCTRMIEHTHTHSHAHSHHCVMKLLLRGPVKPLVEPQKSQHAHSSQYNQSQVALLSRTRSVLLSQIKSIANCISTRTSITAIIMLADSRLLPNCLELSKNGPPIKQCLCRRKAFFSQYD